MTTLGNQPINPALVVVDEGGPIVTKGSEEFAAVVTVFGDDGDCPIVVTVVGEFEVTVVVYPD